MGFDDLEISDDPIVWALTLLPSFATWYVVWANPLGVEGYDDAFPWPMKLVLSVAMPIVLYFVVMYQLNR